MPDIAGAFVGHGQVEPVHELGLVEQRAVRPALERPGHPQLAGGLGHRPHRDGVAGRQVHHQRVGPTLVDRIEAEADHLAELVGTARLPQIAQPIGQPAHARVGPVVEGHHDRGGAAHQITLARGSGTIWPCPTPVPTARQPPRCSWWASPGRCPRWWSCEPEPPWAWPSRAGPTPGELLNLDRNRLHGGPGHDESLKFAHPDLDPDVVEAARALLDDAVRPRGMIYKDVVQPFAVTRWLATNPTNTIVLERPLPDVAFAMLASRWYYPATAVPVAGPGSTGRGARGPGPSRTGVGRPPGGAPALRRPDRRRGPAGGGAGRALPRHGAPRRPLPRDDDFLVESRNGSWPGG